MNLTQLDTYPPEKVHALFGLTVPALSELLATVLPELGARPAVEIVQGIINNVVVFTGGGEQKDDVTLVVVKRTT